MSENFFQNAIHHSFYRETTDSYFGYSRGIEGFLNIEDEPIDNEILEYLYGKRDDLPSINTNKNEVQPCMRLAKLNITDPQDYSLCTNPRKGFFKNRSYYNSSSRWCHPDIKMFPRVFRLGPKRVSNKTSLNSRVKQIFENTELEYPNLLYNTKKEQKQLLSSAEKSMTQSMDVDSKRTTSEISSSSRLTQSNTNDKNIVKYHLNHEIPSNPTYYDAFSSHSSCHIPLKLETGGGESSKEIYYKFLFAAIDDQLEQNNVASVSGNHIYDCLLSINRWRHIKNKYRKHITKNVVHSLSKKGYSSDEIKWAALPYLMHEPKV